MSDSKAETSRGAKTVASAPADAPITVDVTAVTIPERPSARRYWVGMFLDAPLDFYTVGGVTFPKRVGPVEHDPKTHAILDGAWKLGAVVELTDDTVSLIRSRLTEKIARIVGNPTAKDGSYRVMVWSKTAPGYEPRHGDIHVADWLYMVPVTEMMRHDWRGGTPSTTMSGKTREAAKASAV